MKYDANSIIISLKNVYIERQTVQRLGKIPRTRPIYDLFQTPHVFQSITSYCPGCP